MTSIVSVQPSAISYQLSAISYQLSAFMSYRGSRARTPVPQEIPQEIFEDFFTWNPFILT
ncbi:MAG: hypothetical protein SAK29_38735 [Scytonema sp. PMC 1069.18]|nr:hypothetical protein [Scytonema sp. PMC 1069.18]MEC4883033.1 hypothetical protein [Scytonema sp. PMC 1070.18]